MTEEARMRGHPWEVNRPHYAGRPQAKRRGQRRERGTEESPRSPWPPGATPLDTSCHFSLNLPAHAPT
eukprot:7655843-Pyramimonas_sp.AAC.1